jgi:GNAT superfamily N-acetyltransferase
MMISDVKFRRANIDDIENLVEYRIQFLNEVKAHPENETKALEGALKEYFSWAIPSNEFIGWLAEYEGAIVGTSGMVTWRIPGRYEFQSGKYGYILNMYTATEMRRKGIAARLLHRLIAEAKSMGVERLHLHAREAGNALYRRIGFSEPQNPELVLRLI